VLKKPAVFVLTFLSIFVLKTIGFFRKKSLLELKPNGEKSILILTPHADDELLGCGAVLKKQAEHSAQITLVNMTDGGASMSRLDSELLVKIRKKELKAVCRLLGINNIIHLDQPDGNLKPNEEIIKRVATIIDRIKPEIIYVPFFCDFHRDHVATNLILSSALKRSFHTCAIRAYEVQVPITPLLFNSYVEISDWLQIKKNLLRQYQSQSLVLDNVFLAWNLNASFIQKAKNVEVFFSCDSPTYCWLIDNFVSDEETWAKNFYASGNSAKILLAYLKGLRLRKKIADHMQGAGLLRSAEPSSTYS